MGLIHYENGFDDLIKDIAVVDFYATWCGPCKMFGQFIGQIHLHMTSPIRSYSFTSNISTSTKSPSLSS